MNSTAIDQSESRVGTNRFINIHKEWITK